MPDGKVRIYHNPRCSKSRETLALLREHGVDPEVVDYLQNPLAKSEVKALMQKTGLSAHALVRAKEAAYQQAGLSSESSSDEVAGAIAAHPILLERPIVVVGERAAIGRPPEAVLRLL